MFGWGGGSWTIFDTIAEALGLTPNELFTESHDEGKTVVEIAEERGVDLSAVKDTLDARRAEARQEAIQQAVEDGRITQEQADWMLEGIEQGYGLGFGGRGMGRGGHFGMGPGQGLFGPQREDPLVLLLKRFDVDPKLHAVVSWEVPRFVVDPVASVLDAGSLTVRVERFVRTHLDELSVRVALG